MTYDSDITKLIYAMDENQRQDFSSLINNMKDSGLDTKLKKQYSKITCDEIIESIESIE